MQNKAYKETFAISQSAIKTFQTKSISHFKKVYIDCEERDEDETKFAFGSLTDTLAFEPDKLEERFFIADSDVTVPSETIKKIVDKTYKVATVIVENTEKLNAAGNLPVPLSVPNINDLYAWSDTIIIAAKELKYGGTTWSRKRILDNVFSDGRDYFRMLGESNGRQVITALDNADAIELVEILRTNVHTKPYFVQQENETLLFQTEIFTDFPSAGELLIPLKGALDIIRLNHTNGTAQVPDLKTTSQIDDFELTAKKFGYVTQASFYNFLIRQWLKTYNDGAYAEYDILPPCNIVIDRTHRIPHIYEYSWEDLEIAENGSTQLNVEGWRKTLSKIAWHMETGVWDRPREIYENGKIILKIFQT